MALTAYLNIPGIPGESLRVGHEDEIEVHGMSWGIEHPGDGRIGRGRRRSRAEVSPIEMLKIVDRASPYIALAAMQGKSFDEIVLTVRRETGEAHLNYYKITMTNCAIVEVSQVNGGFDDPRNVIEEAVAVDFEKIKILYVEQLQDGSAGEEHEIEHDIAAGA